MSPPKFSYERSESPEGRYHCLRKKEGERVLNNLYPSVVDVHFDPNLRSVSEDKENDPHALNTIKSPSSEKKETIGEVLKEVKLETVHDYTDLEVPPQFEQQFHDDDQEEQLIEHAFEEEFDEEIQRQQRDDSEDNGSEEEQAYT